jgi:hypothetical protein
LQGHLIYELLFADTVEQSELAHRAALLGIPATPQYIVLLVDFDQSYQSLLVGPNLTRSDVLKNGLIELLESFFSRETLPVKLFFETDLRVVAILGLEDEGAGEGLSDSPAACCRFGSELICSPKLSFTVHRLPRATLARELSAYARSYWGVWYPASEAQVPERATTA